MSPLERAAARLVSPILLFQVLFKEGHLLFRRQHRRKWGVRKPGLAQAQGSSRAAEPPPSSVPPVSLAVSWAKPRPSGLGSQRDWKGEGACRFADCAAAAARPGWASFPRDCLNLGSLSWGQVAKQVLSDA